VLSNARLFAIIGTCVGLLSGLVGAVGAFNMTPPLQQERFGPSPAEFEMIRVAIMVAAPFGATMLGAIGGAIVGLLVALAERIAPRSTEAAPSPDTPRG
jgi:hypothetical protein